jgi:Reverse transcriptase (RNA-dependent DNA polymerase)
VVEIEQLRQKGTFILVPRPQGDTQVLPLKWVFTHKLDPAGYLLRYKARICVRGDLQRDPGDDLYAATGAYRTLRILFAIMAAFGLICHSANVTNAYANAAINGDVFVEFPPGFAEPDKAWKLNRALYSLRISPKLWFEELTSYLKSLGYIQCQMSHAYRLTTPPA